MSIKLLTACSSFNLFRLQGQAKRSAGHRVYRCVYTARKEGSCVDKADENEGWGKRDMVLVFFSSLFSHGHAHLCTGEEINQPFLNKTSA